MDPLRVLITGTSGFLGREIVTFLKARGHHVEQIRGRKDFYHLAEILQQKNIQCLIHNGFGVDFSPVGQNPEQSLNLQNTKKAWELAQKYHVRHFIFISAAGVFGVHDSPQAVNEEHLGKTHPLYEGYRQTQYIQEKLLAENIFVPENITLTKLYLTTVYSPDMPAATLGTLKKCQGPLPFMVVPPGGSSYLDLRDFLHALQKIIRTQVSGSFIMNSGNVTFKDLFQTYSKLLGRKKTFLVLPQWSMKLFSWFNFLNKALGIHLDVLKSSFGFKYYSAERLEKKLGTAFNRTLEDTLKYTIDQ